MFTRAWNSQVAKSLLNQKSVQCIRVHWSFLSERIFLGNQLLHFFFQVCKGLFRRQTRLRASGGKLQPPPMTYRTLPWLTDLKTISANYSWKMKVAILFLMAIGLSSAVSPSDILDLRELSEQRMEELFDGLVRPIFLIWICWEIIRFTFLFWASDFPHRQKNYKDALKKKNGSNKDAQNNISELDAMDLTQKNIFRTISSRRSSSAAPAARWTLREPRTRRGSRRDSRGRRGRPSPNRVRKHIHFPQKHLKNKLFEIRRLPRGLQPGRGGQQPLPRKLVERNLVTDSNSNIIFFYY